ncbi:MAG: VWA domain-containing protein, partial [Cytophagales bacterium]|nr:VWA domain-containing protein [Cytophagales bacterium]
RNLAQVVLVSDGIVNQGNSPLYTPYSFPIHTIGLGDTTEKNDLAIKSIYCNKVAFIGNKFPIVAEVQHHGFKGKEITVHLLQKGVLVDKKSLVLENGNGLSKIDFLVSASSKGLQGFTVQIVPLPTESSTKNNTGIAYVDVIDTKSKVLLVSPSPHPDIQAIAKAIAKNENFEFSYYIPGLTEWKEDRYGLVIFHNVPNKFGIGSEVMNKLLAQSVSAWFIAGPEVNWQVLNGINGVLWVDGFNGQTDAVSPMLASDFSAFTFQSSNKEYIPKYPPIEVPFGDIRLGPSAKVWLVQKIGSTTTEKPLLAVAENDGRKMGILLGEGIWQWSLQEYGQFQNQETFDELVMKLVQYLSTTVDKRKLRVFPISNEFLDSEKPTFQAEVYNGLYEKIYGQKIDLEIKSEGGKKYAYTFFNSENGNPFETASLPEGIYSFSAKCLVNNVMETASGQFLVKKISLEALSGTADHALLRRLAGQNQGIYVPIGQENVLLDVFKKNPPKGRAYSKEENERLIDLTWIFFVLLTLISVEWFFRKYLGSY